MTSCTIVVGWKQYIDINNSGLQKKMLSQNSKDSPIGLQAIKEMRNTQILSSKSSSNYILQSTFLFFLPTTGEKMCNVHTTKMENVIFDWNTAMSHGSMENMPQKCTLGYTKISLQFRTYHKSFCSYYTIAYPLKLIIYANKCQNGPISIEYDFNSLS